MDEGKNSELLQPNMTVHRHRAWRSYQPSLVCPAILITIGVVLLLKNIGAITGDVWFTILHLWPLLLIALGVESLFRRLGLATPIFWIGLGIVFLLSELGLANWDALQIIIKFWPLLLIAIGLDVLIPRRSLWASVLGLIVLLAIFAAALWSMGVRIVLH
jgi:hypothetical protein